MSSSTNSLCFDVICKICSFLSFQDRLQIMRANSMWRNAVQSLWSREEILVMTQIPVNIDDFKAIHPPYGTLIVRHSLEDISFWRKIWKLMPNVHTFYICDILEEGAGHSIPVPNPPTKRVLVMDGGSSKVVVDLYFEALKLRTTKMRRKKKCLILR